MDAKQIPYLTHLTEVLAYVILGGGDEDQQIAALLHDAIEDQPFMGDGRYTDDYIYHEFGPRVIGLVWACTDSKPDQVRNVSSWSEIYRKHGVEIGNSVWHSTENKWENVRDSSNWSKRKEHHIAELDKLAEKNPDVLLVSIADKLSNAQAIVADVTQHGSIVWKRFNATPVQIFWYYTQMLELFKNYLEPNHALLHRYAKVVSEMQQLVRDLSNAESGI